MQNHFYNIHAFYGQTTKELEITAKRKPGSLPRRVIRSDIRVPQANCS